MPKDINKDRFSEGTNFIKRIEICVEKRMLTGIIYIGCERTGIRKENNANR